jgi:uncharacterized protein YqgV (UPF0045/DUF77 family)
MPKINIAIQLLPLNGSADAISLIDKAIELIAKSGLVFQVCPFETVVEGEPYDIYQLVEQIRITALSSGCEELIINLKLHSANRSVFIHDKMEKYNR